MSELNRRDFLGAAAAGAAAMTLPRLALGADDPLAAIQAEIVKRHSESVTRLQDWVKQPAIAAENRGMSEGCQLMLKLAKDAGFQKAECVSTDGHPPLTIHGAPLHGIAHRPEVPSAQVKSAVLLAGLHAAQVAD